MKIFMNALEDREMGVKVAALKAISAFLTSINETDLVLQYKSIIPKLIETITKALQENEE